jgi:hypothetical protein
MVEDLSEGRLCTGRRKKEGEEEEEWNDSQAFALATK